MCMDTNSKIQTIVTITNNCHKTSSLFVGTLLHVFKAIVPFRFAVLNSPPGQRQNVFTAMAFTHLLASSLSSACKRLLSKMTF